MLLETSVMIAAMVSLRRYIVGLLALALTFGTGWQSCATLQQQQPSSIAVPTDYVASHHNHADHQTQMAQEHDASAIMVVADESAPKSAGHTCQKCGVCLFASVMPATSQWASVPVYSAVTFASLSEPLRGRVVFVDPDIPKHLA